MQHLTEALPLTDAEVLARATTVLRLEAEAVAATETRLASSSGPGFIQAVRLIQQAPGRVVVSGVGKSALIGQKLVATFNSTGQPSVFMHAADALHGDLGMLQPGDVALIISKSGDTQELKQLVPLIQQGGTPIIALVGNTKGYLARNATAILDASVTAEACPHNLAPTTSTTAALALGDALAVVLLQARGFRREDFARYHPGGSLGKRLYLRVADLAHLPAPAVAPDAPLFTLINTMTAGRLGATLVITEGQLSGIITDGDLRRMLERTPDLSALSQLRAADIMTRNPRSVAADTLAYDALLQMENFSISQLVVRDGASGAERFGLLHLHDLLREGIQ